MPFEQLSAARQSVKDAIDSKKEIVLKTIAPKTINLDVFRPVVSTNSAINSASVNDLGKLSERYESGGNPGRISTGKGDKGGVSYGSYQLASKAGTLKSFLNSSNNTWKTKINYDLFKKDKKIFDTNWKKLAEKFPRDFKNAQHKFIYDTHYKPLANNLKKQKILDIQNRQQAVKDTVWSVAVQHGAESIVIQTALKGTVVSKLSDANIIRLIYKERGATNSKGILKYFPSSPNVKKGLIRRFRDEEIRALKMLNPSQKIIKPTQMPVARPKGMNNKSLPLANKVLPTTKKALRDTSKSISHVDLEVFPTKQIPIAENNNLEVFSMKDLPTEDPQPAYIPPSYYLETGYWGDKNSYRPGDSYTST